MNIAIILAGGSGTRLGGGLPKQFMKVAGKKVVEHTIDVFEKNEKIDEIAIVCKSDYIPEMDTIFKELPSFFYRYKKTLTYPHSTRDCYVKTDNNTYLGCDNISFYFQLNGKDHFTETYRRLHNMDNSDSADEPKTNSEPKYSGKAKIYNDFDPDDPDTYDDPEDYWDEYGDYEDEEERDY